MRIFSASVFRTASYYCFFVRFFSFLSLSLFACQPVSLHCFNVEMGKSWRAIAIGKYLVISIWAAAAAHKQSGVNVSVSVCFFVALEAHSRF